MSTLSQVTQDDGEGQGDDQLAGRLGPLVEAEAALAVHLDPVVDQSDSGRAADGQHGDQSSGREGAVDVRDQIADDGRPDDGHPSHGRRAGLGEVALGTVLADLLTDALRSQPVDEERRAEHGDQQGDTAGQEQVGHRLPAPGRQNPGERGPGRLDVVEGQQAAADLLAALVTLAGDHDDVARLGHGQRRG